MITGSERAIRYSELGRVLQEYQPEILLLPANWEFNFPLVENIIETAENKIKSLNVILFSCTNTVAIVMNRKKIKRFGWTDADVKDIKISTESMTNEEGRTSNVSSIEICLTIKTTKKKSK